MTPPRELARSLFAEARYSVASASVVRDFMTSRAFLARDVFISPSFAAVTSLNFCAFTESRPFSPSSIAA